MNPVNDSVSESKEDISELKSEADIDNLIETIGKSTKPTDKPTEAKSKKRKSSKSSDSKKKRKKK